MIWHWSLGHGLHLLIGLIHVLSFAPLALAAGEIFLDLLHRFVPCLWHEDGGEEAANEADAAIQPECPRLLERRLHQVNIGLGDYEACDEGKADDEGVGHGSHLKLHFQRI